MGEKTRGGRRVERTVKGKRRWIIGCTINVYLNVQLLLRHLSFCPFVYMHTIVNCESKDPNVHENIYVHHLKVWQKQGMWFQWLFFHQLLFVGILLLEFVKMLYNVSAIVFASREDQLNDAIARWIVDHEAEYWSCIHTYTSYFIRHQQQL